MRPDRIRPPQRMLAGVATLALAGTGFVACGEGGDEAQSVAIEVDEKKGKSELQAPSSAETGVTEIKFTNNAEKPHDVQLIRVVGKHSASEVLSAAERAFGGKPFPDWLFAGGGVGPTEPGQSQTVTQILRPGTYFVFATGGGPPDPKSVPAIEVTGETSDEELPETDVRVSAIDYAFETEGLTTGENTVLFENTGAQPHHMIAAPIDKGKTIEDVRKAEGQPPIDEKREVTTAILEGGESQVVTLDFDKGKYALVCFITDRQGGPPHVEKGMLDEAVVK